MQQQQNGGMMMRGGPRGGMRGRGGRGMPRGGGPMMARGGGSQMMGAGSGYGGGRPPMRSVLCNTVCLSKCCNKHIKTDYEKFCKKTKNDR